MSYLYMYRLYRQHHSWWTSFVLAVPNYLWYGSAAAAGAAAALIWISVRG